jgi:hypothetical protein
VGGNAFITGILGEKKYSKMAVERLQKAATLSIDAPTIAQRGNNVSFNVSITNSGAGHKIPTGVSEIRQIWLAVSVKDRNGNEIYHTGDVNENGTIVNAMEIYNTILGDAQGEPTLSFWLAESILKDNRISPKGTVSENHTFIIPDEVTYPLSIEATLKYRSAPQHLIDYLFGEMVYEVPVIDMKYVSTNVYENEEDASKAIPSTPGVGVLGSISVLLFIAEYIGKRKKMI